ncbi:MAG: ribonuclease H [Saprospiraceae bacterium]|nr:ribonuclease H [Saprospiraceae bacterium]
MARKKKYYVVWNGVHPGVYESWNECKQQIAGYPGAKYKAFQSLAEAEEAFTEGFGEHISVKKSVRPTSYNQEGIIWQSISVDAACSGNPGIMEYRGVDTKLKTELFRKGPFRRGTNNIGEFLALVHALALLQKENKLAMPIYSDSRTAMAWVRNKNVKTTLKRDRINSAMFELVDRALLWLKSNSYRNPIIKWDTKSWGEIPADFGRK